MENTTTCQSPFNALERTFRTIATPPRPLALERGAVRGLPNRALPLTELRNVLTHPVTPYLLRDQTIRVLLRRAQTGNERWTVGLAGLVLPGLRRAVSPLIQACPTKAADIEAEAIAGLVEGIGATNPRRSYLAARLIDLARKRAQTLVTHELAEADHRALDAVSKAPAPPFGHPDLVLAHAVADGVLCAEDAALIGDTRLGLLRVTDAAAALGITAKAAYKRRDRAEQALVAYLHDPEYSGIAFDAAPGFVETSSGAPAITSVGRPRGGRRLDRQPAACPPPTDRRR